MKLLPIQNTRTNGVSVSAQSNTQNNTHPLQSKMQIRTGYLNHAASKNSAPSFGWFILDDLFYYFNRKLNSSRELELSGQIQDVNKKVVDDITLLSKKLGISPAVAKVRYQECLDIGGIKPKGNGYEEGLNKVIGYNAEKLDLIQNVVTPLVIDAGKNDGCYPNYKNPDVPNGVLFYGPRGRGKSYMAECLLEHLNKKRHNIYTRVISKNWDKGDTDENAFAIAKTFEEAKKRYEQDKIRTVIYIEELDRLLNENNNPILCAEFIAAATDCRKNGITWIGTITAPKAMPDWLFDPHITNVSMPVKAISDVEQSALMSYFWAKHDRLDKSNHNTILNYFRDNDIKLYPPQFEKIAKNVNEKLNKKDYKSEKRGNYRAPVTTDVVLNTIREHLASRELGIGDKQKLEKLQREELVGLDDAAYINKIQDKHYGNKLLNN